MGRGASVFIGRVLGMSALLISCAAALATETNIRVAHEFPVSRGNDFYQGNRPPLLPSPLVKLPIGSIRPEGWLRTQLEYMADGMTGRLEEISKWCNFDESAWTQPSGEGKWGWEEMPYWLKGYGDLGYVLGHEKITANATRWVEAIMASQRSDGTFGPKENFERNDLWPHMCTLYALRSYHEATGDEQVIDVMTKYFKYVASIPPEALYTWEESYGSGWWQYIRAADHLDSMHWLYNRTGDKWLLDLARVNHERTADWTAGIANWHGVNIAEAWRGPAQWYQQSHDPAHLQAAIRNYNEVREKFGQVPGGMYGADENCREGYTGPRQGAETCAIVEMMHSHEMLLKITGDTLWADRCEDVAFNSMPPSCTPDHKALHYLTAPNQIQLCRANKAPMIQNGGDMFSYTPYEQYRCCQHNVAYGWPYYAEHLWFATPENGLAAAMYAPSTVTAKVGDGQRITVEQITDYPFGETVEFRFSAQKPVAFPFALRIPNWCDKPGIEINDQHVDGGRTRGERGRLRPGGAWTIITRTFTDGDVLRLTLPMRIRTRVWDENFDSVSIDRGPLTYSLKIKEKWLEYDTHRSWPGFEVAPRSAWNYGLVLDEGEPAESMRFVEAKGPLPAQPFTAETAPVRIIAKGKRIPEWQQEKNGLVGEIQQSPVRSDAPVEDITLIPMGCARLRIASFPLIGEGPDAHVWKPLPPRMAVTASWSNPGDTLEALMDGKLPADSADMNIPRFTFWDHLGTKEWIEIDPPEAMTIDSLAIYWYDDGDLGYCRVPASWSVVWRDEGAWKPVENAGPYDTEADRFNVVNFKPITFNKLRIKIQLQPGYSAGILECRLGER